jgi:hypothetical protein
MWFVTILFQTLSFLCTVAQNSHDSRSDISHEGLWNNLCIWERIWELQINLQFSWQLSVTRAWEGGIVATAKTPAWRRTRARLVNLLYLAHDVYSTICYFSYILFVNCSANIFLFSKMRAFCDVAPCSLVDECSLPWWWGQYAPLKRRFASTRLHGATSHIAVISVSATVWNWNRTRLYF